MNALIVYKENVSAKELGQKLVDYLFSQGHTGRMVSCPCFYEQAFDDIDFVFVLGGDGTLLQTAKYLSKKSIPILGVNFGKIGFLSSIQPAALFNHLELILNNEYHLESRIMIDVTLSRNSTAIYSGIALNDAVIRSCVAHPIEIAVTMQKGFTKTFCGDGVICATATGSTAYSLSAGGPILLPDVKAILITPICSQKNADSAFVVPLNRILEYDFKSNHKTALYIDGQKVAKLYRGDRLLIQQSKCVTNLVRFNG